VALQLDMELSEKIYADCIAGEPVDNGPSREPVREPLAPCAAPCSHADER
jgi:hypothetical protein